MEYHVSNYNKISNDRMCRVLVVYTSLPTVCNGICYSIVFHSPAQYVLRLKWREHRWIAQAIRIISSEVITPRQIPNAVISYAGWKKKQCYISWMCFRNCKNNDMALRSGTLIQCHTFEICDRISNSTIGSTQRYCDSDQKLIIT